MKKNSLSKKFITVTITSYIVITSLITIIQLTLTYLNTRSKVAKEIEQVPQTYGPSIGAAIWSFNDDALISSVNGLLEKDMIAGVNVKYSSEELSVGIVKNGSSYSKYNFSGNKVETDVKDINVHTISEFQFPIVFKSIQEEEHTVGVMKIYVSDEIFYNEIKNNLLVIVTNSLVILFVLTVVAYILLRRIISDPLNLLVSEIDKISFSNLDESFLFSVSKDDDEIRHLEHSFNNLISKLVVSKQELNLLNAGLEEQIKERTADLIGALEQAKQSSKAKTQFLANMSHELRTPLNAITGFSGVLLEDLKDSDIGEENLENLKNINSSSEHLTQIVNDILSLSKIESGKMGMDIAPCNIKTVCSSVYNMTLHLANDKNIDFKFLIDSNCDVTIKTDETKIKQILLNLISNAIKFTQTDGHIEFIVKLIDKELDIRVVDSGIGIEETKVNLIFKEFEQAEMSTTKKFGGTGLGLTISKKLVSMLNGEISVESEVNKGSTFKVLFPVEFVEGETLSKSDVSSHSIEDMNFLVFEDNKLNQKLVRKLLEKAGAHCEIAHDGVDGLDKLKSNLPDVILMDLHMPNMNGIEATKEIRKKYSAIDLPIFALSADIMEESIEESKAVGMNGFLSKPIKMNDLIYEVAKAKKGPHEEGQ